MSQPNIVPGFTGWLLAMVLMGFGWCGLAMLAWVVESLWKRIDPKDRKGFVWGAVTMLALVAGYWIVYCLAHSQL